MRVLMPQILKQKQNMEEVRGVGGWFSKIAYFDTYGVFVNECEVVSDQLYFELIFQLTRHLDKSHWPIF